MSRTLIGSRPPRRMRSVRHNLLPQPTALLGRDADLHAVQDELLSEDVRLLTLSGPPGIGKTRLAMALGELVLEGFSDGVWLVSLAPCSDEESVLATIGATLSLAPIGDYVSRDALEAYLRERRMLLILDNFEHVLCAAAQVAELLAGCPGLKVLVTSREALHLHWEHLFLVPPLALPDLGQQLSVDELLRIPSTNLFLSRARAVRRDLVLSADNASAIAQICVRLDGLPLAIELAAAHANVFSPSAMIARLDHHLSLMHWESRDSPVRHRTLRAALDWSYDLLTGEEQRLFRRLAVFVDGFTADAAHETICPMATRGDTIDLLATLVDKNVVQVRDLPDGEPRFSLLETIRDYALEKLDASGELEEARTAHSAYFLQLADTIGQVMGSEQVTWLLELERENLHAALAGVDPTRRAEIELRLAATVAVFWRGLGYLGEGPRWLDHAVNEGLGYGSATRSEAEEDALAADSLFHLALLLMDSGDLSSAEHVFRESLPLYEQIENASGIASVLICNGEALRLQGRYAEAEVTFREALQFNQAHGLRRGSVYALSILAWLAGKRGDRAAAIDLLHQCLLLSQGSADKSVVIWCAEGTVELAGGDGDPYALAQLLGALSALRQVAGLKRPAMEDERYRQAADRVRTRIPEDRFTSAWREGQQQSLDAVVDLALSLVETAERHGGQAGLLSAREREVLELIAAGHSNRAIAAMLTVSNNTVKSHVNSVLNKLGAESRAQAVALATRKGLL